MEFIEKIFTKRSTNISALYAMGSMFISLLLMLVLPSMYASLSMLIMIMFYTSLGCMAFTIGYGVKLIALDKVRSPVLYGYLAGYAFVLIIGYVYLSPIISALSMASLLFGGAITDFSSIIALVAYTAIGETFVVFVILLCIISAIMFVLTILVATNKLSIGDPKDEGISQKIDVAAIVASLKNPIVLKIVGGCLVAVVLFVGGIFVIDMLNTKTIDAMTPVTIEFSGYDGEGVAKITEGEFEYDKKDFDQVSFVRSIEYEISQDDELFNQDEITIKAIYDEEEAERLNIKVTNTERVVKVEGLKEVLRSVDQLPPETLEELRTNAKKEAEDDVYSLADGYTVELISEHIASDPVDGGIKAGYVSYYKATGLEKTYFSSDEPEQAGVLIRVSTGHVDLDELDDIDLYSTNLTRTLEDIDSKYASSLEDLKEDYKIVDEIK